jgi:hypothetical protein
MEKTFVFVPHRADFGLSVLTVCTPGDTLGAFWALAGALGASEL